MRYHLDNQNYQNFKIFEENKLAPHAYFIPFSKKELAESCSYLEAREKSDRVRLLNGTWDFKYYPKVTELPEWMETTQTDFDKVPVPSMWQFTGYEPPYYTNICYEFKPAPPKIPTTEPVGKVRARVDGKMKTVYVDKYNSVGVYRKMFEVKTGGRKFLSFLGVSPCLVLYLNGHYVGYSEGSHNTAEFEITDFVQEGENELVGVVHKWCNGTYLEAQDMFRSNGIFRDVLLRETAGPAILDFQFDSKKRPDGKYDLAGKITLMDASASTKVMVELLDGAKPVAKGECNADGNILFKALNAEEWSAETPKLYDVYLRVAENGKEVECVREAIGFKEVRVDGERFLFNGRPIKIKGVNHHDSNPKTGYYMTPADMLQDVQLMKQLNVNAVRTSHYPPDPMFLQICDRYGLYVVDEADIETHGCGMPPILRVSYISRDLRWKEHYWDRVSRMYYRDRNRASIIMWSLGNESGGYQCQDYCYQNMKKLTPIPIHYEGVGHTRRRSYDVNSKMYSDIKTLQEVKARYAKWDSVRFKPLQKLLKAWHRLIMPYHWTLSDGYSGKPFFLCEYAHAMGVGPGSMEDYQQMFYSDDIFMGGCVWEWCDHAIYHENDPYRYTYGGDHAEPYHDGNFCVDGMVFPDRTPSTGALTMQAVFRPLRSEMQNGVLTIRNTDYFKDSAEIAVEYRTLSHAGEILHVGLLDLLVQPQQQVSVEIPALNGAAFVNVVYTRKENGQIIATEQHAVNPEYSGAIKGNPCMVTIDPAKECIIAPMACGEFVLDAKTGMIESFGDGGFLPPQRLLPEVFRAPTDNDRNIKHTWIKAGFRDFTTEFESCSAEDNRVEIRDAVMFEGKVLFHSFMRLEFYENGFVVNHLLEPVKRGLPNLPKVGVQLKITNDISEVRYFGRGPQENYPDFKEHAPMGLYDVPANGFAEPYIRPQESGNRMDVRFADLVNAQGDGIRIVAEQSLHLNVKNLNDVALSACDHPEEIKPDDYKTLNLDGHMMGVGSNSCGPQALDEYQLPADTEYRTVFMICPL